ncbi:DNA polymerase IV [uncultured Thiohalocapsa sp.]|uniref:DNA polymerase IV n=1 Tax=uncultured Thiohalocapsa sp. TaxID=768990 RepID=UPI0025EB5B92|nr:DNA polymerase IV [uncultured Thiohalocapsa sp.]
MQRWVMHLDMDAFYAAVEQRDDPSLRGRPVVVGARPGGRGVVATCSYEARRFGIRSAMPIAEAYRRCPDAVYLRPRMAHYAAVSRRIRRELDGISPLVEAVSIDEACVDVSGLERLFGPPAAIGALAKRRIRDACGLTASVGIGPNRLIAKLASEYRKPDGLTVVAPDQVQAFLDPQPVAVLRGVGARTLPRLERLGIRSVADLRRRPIAELQRHLGPRLAAALHAQARGIGPSDVVPDTPRKSISKETTFAQDQTDPALLHARLRQLAGEVAHTARAGGLAGGVVTLKVRYAGFVTHSRQRRLAAPTDSERVLLAEAWRLFEHGGLPQAPVRLIGLGLAALTEPQLGPQSGPQPHQRDLFEAADAPRRDNRLAQTLDAVNARFGDGVLGFGLAAGAVQPAEAGAIPEDRSRGRSPDAADPAPDDAAGR